jgi:2-oxoglutarate ferredoxin oxidoreductase subunit beta
MATVKDFRNELRPNWCPGCGDFSVQASIQRTLASMGKEPHEVALISGIGCSGRISGYVNTYGFHGVHGRSLPTAQGVKLANRDLTVLASGGDGDGFGIGLNHFMHAVRRNIDITYIVMDNQIYGLTKGQHSPTSAHGFTAKTTPTGNIENALVPTQIALAAGIGYLAQGFSSDVNQLCSLIEQGINYKGFALINVFSPCVTYNKINTYDFFRENVHNLDKVEGYDPTDRSVAMKAIADSNGLCTGLIFKDESRVAYQDQITGYHKEPLVDADINLDPAVFAAALKEFA